MKQIGVTAQNGEQPIRLPNGLMYPRVEVEQRTHSGDEIASFGHLFVIIIWPNKYIGTKILTLYHKISGAAAQSHRAEGRGT